MLGKMGDLEKWLKSMADFTGEITIVITLLLSKIVYILLALLSQFMFIDFVWGKKKHKFN